MIDYYDLNTDWIKTKWSLPAYKSKAFFDYLEATKNTLDRFKKQQVYLAATESGLIVDDEWTNNQVNWSDNFYQKNTSFSNNLEFRREQIRKDILDELTEAQTVEGRPLTIEETGRYILGIIGEYFAAFISEDDINISKANTKGIVGLEPIDNEEIWASVLGRYSANFIDRISREKLPEIYIKKDIKKPEYIKSKKLILIQKDFDQLSYAAAKFFETIDLIGKASKFVRDNDAVSNNPITIGDKKALEGPWIDIQDGILNTDGSTEYFPMIAQRVYRQNPVEIANNWNRNPNQILLYMSISAGNFING